MTTTIIGGSDGPTSVFIVGKVGPDWINIGGLIIVILMLMPNIIYAIKNRNEVNKCENKVMNIVEQIGRYASMFLMIFNIGIFQHGFPSVNSLLLYFIGNITLLITYWIIWGLYIKKKKMWSGMALAIIPTGIFMLSGIALLHIPLMISALLFGIGHIYVTYQNQK